MGVRSTNTTQSFGSDFYRSGSDVTRAYVKVYTEDVFHTQLYSGTGGLETINTGFDLLGKGGLVILKNKNEALRDWIWTDTERGSYKSLRSSTTGDEGDDTDYGINLTSTGFTAGKSGMSNPLFNSTTADFCSWTFCKQPGFFDIVTYDGDQSGSRGIPHNLQCVPGLIIVKCTSDTGENWNVYHRSAGATKYFTLDTPNALNTSVDMWQSVNPTSTHFIIGQGGGFNQDGRSYVAYLFAHDEPRFGDYEDQDIIKCEKATMPASGEWHDVDLGWEPQWILVKPDANTTNWQIFDSRRGIVAGTVADPGNERALNPNTTDGETTAHDYIDLNGNGFRIKVSQYGTNNDVYYVAIRKGMKKPTDATKVFNPKVYQGTNNALGLTQDFAPVDLYDGGRLFWTKIYTGVNNGTSHALATNKIGQFSLQSDTTSGDTAFTNIVWDNPEFVHLNAGAYNSSNNTHISWNFKTAAGFFDIVTWQGNGAANRALTHNLGVQPELLIMKRRTATDNWNISTPDLVTSGEGFFFNTQNKRTGMSAFGGSGVSAPTSSVFYVGSDTIINGSSDNYIALLFASCPGVSKIGTYSGNTGNNVDVDCGFTSNARFVMIKRTDTEITTPSQEETNWWIFDENLGYNGGSDYVMQANTADPRVTGVDWLSTHPDNKGFTVNSGAIAALNATGGTYLYLAIA